MKDLVDLALLIGSGGLDKQRILDAPPPADWQIPFQALAEECGLQTDVAAVFSGVREFFEELLGRRTER